MNNINIQVNYGNYTLNYDISTDNSVMSLEINKDTQINYFKGKYDDQIDDGEVIVHLRPLFIIINKYAVNNISQDKETFVYMIRTPFLLNKKINELIINAKNDNDHILFLNYMRRSTTKDIIELCSLNVSKILNENYTKIIEIEFNQKNKDNIKEQLNILCGNDCSTHEFTKLYFTRYDINILEKYISIYNLKDKIKVNNYKNNYFINFSNSAKKSTKSFSESEKDKTIEKYLINNYKNFVHDLLLDELKSKYNKILYYEKILQDVNLKQNLQQNLQTENMKEYSILSELIKEENLVFEKYEIAIKINKNNNYNNNNNVNDIFNTNKSSYENVQTLIKKKIEKIGDINENIGDYHYDFASQNIKDYIKNFMKIYNINNPLSKNEQIKILNLKDKDTEFLDL